MLETIEVPRLLNFEEYLKKLRQAGFLVISGKKITKEIENIFNQQNQQRDSVKFLVSQLRQSFFSSSVNKRIHGFDYNVSAVFEFLLLEETQKKLRKVGTKEGEMFVFPLSCNGNFFWIYSREINKQLYCYFNSNTDGHKKIKFCGEWETVHFKEISIPSTHQFINESQKSGGYMLEIKKFECLPFKVTSYQKDIHWVLESLQECGVNLYINNKKLSEIIRYDHDHRIINPFLFLKNGHKSLVMNLLRQPLPNMYIWDFDAMCQISKDLVLSDENFNVGYASLIPTANGKAGMAVCTVTRNKEGVELGLHSSHVCKTIKYSSDHPINSQVIAFANNNN